MLGRQASPLSFWTATLGALKHMVGWVVSSTGEDIVYHNPRFNPNTSPEEAISIWCVHGTADRNHAFINVALNLQDNLSESVSSIHLAAFEDRFSGQDIVHFANQLREKIRQSGAKNVILLGHSRGGLVVAYFTEYFAAEDSVNVKAVFSLGAPLDGSDWALDFLAWLSKSVDQMQKSSDFLMELVEKIKHSKSLYYFYAGLKDALVSAASAFVPAPQHVLTLLPDDGHLSMMGSKELFRHIR